jgi:hypothetical protein
MALILISLTGVPQTISAQSVAGVKCAALPDATAHLNVLERWISDVWHQGRVEQVADLVGATYVRHEAAGTRTVSAAQYTAEIVAVRRALPDVRFVLHDCAAIGDRVWLRWTMIATNGETGKVIKRMGTQVYRLAESRLVETWMLMLPMDAAWPEQTDTTSTKSLPPAG